MLVFATCCTYPAPPPTIAHSRAVNNPTLPTHSLIPAVPDPTAADFAAAGNCKPTEPTLPDAMRTYNVDGESWKGDWTKYNPWRSPGLTGTDGGVVNPEFQPCGVNSGGSNVRMVVPGPRACPCLGPRALPLDRELESVASAAWPAISPPRTFRIGLPCPCSRSCCADRDYIYIYWGLGSSSPPRPPRRKRRFCVGLLQAFSGPGTGTEPHSVNGTDLPRLLSKPGIWKVGTAIPIEWSIFANHGGGYSYRICKVDGDEKPTEECFQRTPLEFATPNTTVVYVDGSQPTISFAAMTTSEGTPTLTLVQCPSAGMCACRPVGAVGRVVVASPLL